MTLAVLALASAAHPATWTSQLVANPSQDGFHPAHPAIYVDEGAGPGRLDVVWEISDTDPEDGTEHDCDPITEDYVRRLYARNVRLDPPALGPRVLLWDDMEHNATISPYVIPYRLPGERVFAVLGRMTRNRDQPAVCAEDHTGLQMMLVDADTHDIVLEEPIVDLDDSGQAVCESAGVAAFATHPDPVDPLEASGPLYAAFTWKHTDDDVGFVSRAGDGVWPTYGWDAVDTPLRVGEGPSDQDHPALAVSVIGDVARQWVAYENGDALWVARVDADGTVDRLRLDANLAPGSQSNLPHMVQQPLVGVDGMRGSRLHLVWQEVAGSTRHLAVGQCDDTATTDCTELADWTITDGGIAPAGTDPRSPEIGVVRDGPHVGTVMLAYVDDAAVDTVHVAWRCTGGQFEGVWQDDVVDGSQGSEAMRLRLSDLDDQCAYVGWIPRASPQVVSAGDLAVVAYTREEGLASGDWSVRVAHAELDDLCPDGP